MQCLSSLVMAGTIGETNVKIYQDHVPDLQNPSHLTRIIVRSEDEAFWNQCIDVNLSGHIVCYVVGTPGIGKRCPPVTKSTMGSKVSITATDFTIEPVFPLPTTQGNI